MFVENFAQFLFDLFNFLWCFVEGCKTVVVIETNVLGILFGGRDNRYQPTNSHVSAPTLVA